MNIIILGRCSKAPAGDTHAPEPVSSHTCSASPPKVRECGHSRRRQKSLIRDIWRSFLKHLQRWRGGGGRKLETGTCVGACCTSKNDSHSWKVLQSPRRRHTCTRACFFTHLLSLVSKSTRVRPQPQAPEVPHSRHLAKFLETLKTRPQGSNPAPNPRGKTNQDFRCTQLLNICLQHSERLPTTTPLNARKVLVPLPEKESSPTRPQRRRQKRPTPQQLCLQSIQPQLKGWPRSAPDSAPQRDRAD